MSIIEFHLFRVKFAKRKQLPLEFNNLTPSELFARVISEKPSYEFRAGYNWHIGNVEQLTTTRGYFAVGRTTSSILEKFDLQSKNFVEEMYDTSPYTHVLYNTELGLMAIGKKGKLSPTVFGISSKIEKMFSLTDIIRQSGVIVDIDFIRDPKSFIQKLESAFSIKKYSASFGGPNPFDADEYFQKPMSLYLKEANGDNGKTIIEGKDLDTNVVIEVSKAIARTGNDASARIQNEYGKPLTTVSLGQNSIKFPVNADDFDKNESLVTAEGLFGEIR